MPPGHPFQQECNHQRFLRKLSGKGTFSCPARFVLVLWGSNRFCLLLTIRQLLRTLICQRCAKLGSAFETQLRASLRQCSPIQASLQGTCLNLFLITVGSGFFSSKVGVNTGHLGRLCGAHVNLMESTCRINLGRYTGTILVRFFAL